MSVYKGHRPVELTENSIGAKEREGKRKRWKGGAIKTRAKVKKTNRTMKNRRRGGKTRGEEGGLRQTLFIRARR